jgi:hypothetical protein
MDKGEDLASTKVKLITSEHNGADSRIKPILGLCSMECKCKGWLYYELEVVVRNFEQHRTFQRSQPFSSLALSFDWCDLGRP